MTDVELHNDCQVMTMVHEPNNTLDQELGLYSSNYAHDH